MQRKHIIRRRGADLTQALLFSAIAVALVIGVMYLRTVVDAQQKRMATMSGFTQISNEARTQSRLGANPGNLYNNILQSGSIAEDLVLNMVDREFLILPYWGLVDVYDDLSTNGYVISVVYSFPSEKAVQMCNYLSRGTVGQFQSSGPLGTDYAIGTRNCYAPDYPLFTVVYKY